MNPPADIAEALDRARDRLGPFARDVRWFPDIGSTNDAAARLADGDAPEGTVVAADAQTAGRGRHGRTWASPAGAGLYVSIVLRPRGTELPLLTIAAGVAAADGVEAATGLGPALKWPNDVYLAGRKVAGLLAEGAGEAVVLGIGVNVMPAAYPPDVAARATNLEQELGRPVDRGLLLAEILAAVAHRYAMLQQGGGAAIVAAWRRRAGSLLGRQVRWTAGDRTLSGIADTIDDRGALLVRTPAGIERIISGDVRWT